MFKRIAVLLLCLVLAVSACACGGAAKTRYEAEFLFLFDTVTRIVAYMPDRESFDALSRFIYDNLQDYHRLYDIYNDYEGVSNIKTINDHAGQEPVKVDRRIIDLLRYARQAYDDTDGQVNVAMGAVLVIWHEYRERGVDDPQSAALPTDEELEEAARHTDINDIVIDEPAGTVFLRDPDMRLDVGAVAKGYAVEQVCRLAREAGYANVLVSVGGNVEAIGDKGVNEELWNVGVQNPDKSDGAQAYLAVARVKDGSLVTSGDYERYYTVDGRRYHHIIDPDTLYPAVYFTALTILCQSSAQADMLSTAVFNMPLAQGRAFIAALPGVEALWVLPDGEIVYSEHFEEYVQS